MTDPAWVEAHFTSANGAFRFARWGRPIAPVIVGTNDEGCRIFEEAIRAVADVSGLEVGELDPDTGANFLVYLVNGWAELTQAPNLVRMIPNLAELIGTLEEAKANQYRVFGFDEAGAIRLCVTLLRYDDELQAVSAQTLAVGQALQGILLWSDTAFAEDSPIAIDEDGVCGVKPEHAALLKAAYDPVLPNKAEDASLALRIAARLSQG